MQLLRLRARRRLIGAAVLVAAGMVGFPLIFETQPRPIPVDLPIEIPSRDTAPPLAVPAREPQAQAQTAPPPAATPVVQAPPVEPKVAEVPVEKPAQKTEDRAAERLADKPVEHTATRPADKPQDKPPVKVAEKPAEKPAERVADKVAEKPKAASNDGARALALLEGKEATGVRFIVQVGAYGENKAAQDMRAKVEKLGLKTYAQAVETPDGHRVRVRLGPFASRDEAERAAAKLKGAGLPGSVLTL
ncbi:SPOR domain-containing protein [Roseateles sp. BYS96W]|uniref:SPOR domain-containing protein n=1 Tax=Pelomonas nitida TaxID=3299027 RepID=A0ABW7G5E6_9BURK